MATRVPIISHKQLATRKKPEPHGQERKKEEKKKKEERGSGKGFMPLLQRGVGRRHLSSLPLDFKQPLRTATTSIMCLVCASSSQAD